MGRLRKKAAGKARESLGMRRTVAYAAISLPLRRQGKAEAQRIIQAFYESVKFHNSADSIPSLCAGLSGDFMKWFVPLAPSEETKRR